MSDSDVVYDQESLLGALEHANGRAAEYFASQRPERLFQQEGAGWSAAQNLEHLIRSVQPLAKAMRLPKVTLRLMFGTPKRSSRSHAEVKAAYLLELSKGAQASGNFLPSQTAVLDSAVAAARTKLLARWKVAADGLVKARSAWDDADLDQYLLPHPILGALTVREMLFFTIIHNSRHATPQGD